MKKFTFYSFLLLFILCASTSIGANGPKKNVVNILPPFYTETFSVGIPGNWQNNDSSIAVTGAIWKYTTTGSSNNQDALDGTGTTAANGYAIFDSDEIFPTDADAWLISDAIDCSSKSNVHLIFAEFYKQDQSNQGRVYVSNDGVNWGLAIYNADSGLASLGTTPNANFVDRDISTIADGQATVYIAFRYSGGGGYYWMVDDIGLYEASTTSVDVGVTAILAPMTSCNTLTSTEKVTIRVKNFGLSDIDSIPVFYVINGGAPVLDTLTDTIPAGGTKDFSFVQTADLSAGGLATIVAGTTLSGDVDPSNNLDSTIITSGPKLLPYTNGFETLVDGLGWATSDVNNDDTTWEASGVVPHTGAVCVAFDNDAPNKDGDDWIFSPCISITDLTYSYKLSFWYTTLVPGATDANLDAYILSAQNPGSVIMKLDSLPNISNSAYLQTESYFTVPSAGNYYFGWHVTHTSNPTPNTSVRIDDINIDLYVKSENLTSNKNEVIVYPNPNNGTFSIVNLKSFSGQAQVTVLDMMGRTVSSKAVNGLDKITMNVGEQAAGVYTVRISNDTQVLNKLITITK